MATAIAVPPGARVARSTSAPTKAAQGIVISHAKTMFRAIPQRTADKLVVAPAPKIALEMVCVVDTGNPSRAVNHRMVAVVVSAANP